ncbi:MAG: hypothetical protein WBL21_09575 [Salinimicrobium sp.]
MKLTKGEMLPPKTSEATAINNRSVTIVIRNTANIGTDSFIKKVCKIRGFKKVTFE